jgi:hypothetical protein
MSTGRFDGVNAPDCVLNLCCVSGFRLATHGAHGKVEKARGFDSYVKQWVFHDVLPSWPFPRKEGLPTPMLAAPVRKFGATKLAQP